MPQSRQTPRPLLRSSYYELRKRYQQRTDDYLEALVELEHELAHRQRPWPVELRNEVRQQIKQVKDGMNRLS